MSFASARVLAFESRRAKEIAELIRMNGGEPFVAPALVEVPLAQNQAAFEFADRLYRSEFEMLILLTGVGTRLLQKILATRDPEEKFFAALRRLAIVARGPKPAGVLREWQIPIAVSVPEPNTWRELLVAVAGRSEHSVAIQEYGKTNQELVAGLEAQGRTVLPVRVYQWQLPEDTGPLAIALNDLLAGKFQAALFTTGVQIEHFLNFAERTGKREAAQDALRRIFVGSIGPTCSESLGEFGIKLAMEPSHPKMGIFVREAAATYAEAQRTG
ncbi:MAG: uroporphyrinogen-III synthase [Acidobacteriaceae bacterium]|nr:uroporphyrinogen-III synthase [Acidobacteriaceae bacterium]